MEQAQQFIEALGFPIFVCIVAFLGIKYVYDTMKTQNEQQAEKHAVEVKTLTDALNNNTLVLQKLCDTLDAKDSPANADIDTDAKNLLADHTPEPSD